MVESCPTKMVTILANFFSTIMAKSLLITTFVVVVLAASTEAGKRFAPNFVVVTFKN
jgi:hypothetical protein